MIIPIVFPSAAMFWFHYNPRIAPDRYAIEHRKLLDLPAEFGFEINKKMGERIVDFLNLKMPVSLWCSHSTQRRDTRLVKVLKRPDCIPRHGFIEIGEIQSVPEFSGTRILIASPEMCFLQAANVLSFQQLVMFGTELCGLYHYDQNSEYGQRSRKPVTSSKSIREFLINAEGCIGRRRALRAVDYILDRSNSFMESMLAVMVCLPINQGGYALIRPQMNAPLRISEAGKVLLRGRNIYGDMVWEMHKIVLEYDSDLSHLSSEQHKRDKERQSAMTLSGYTVINVTKQHVATYESLDELFRMLRKKLKMRSTDVKLQKYTARRKELIRMFWTFRSNDPGTYPKKTRRRAD